jgi:hypothetical protein
MSPVAVLAGAGAALPSSIDRRMVNWLDTALHITVLHHGLYVGAIPILR